MNTQAPHRRNLLVSAALLAIAAPRIALAAVKDAFASSPFRRLSDAEWRKRLPVAGLCPSRSLRWELLEAGGSNSRSWRILMEQSRGMKPPSAML